MLEMFSFTSTFPNLLIKEKGECLSVSLSLLGVEMSKAKGGIPLFLGTSHFSTQLLILGGIFLPRLLTVTQAGRLR